MDNYTTSDLLPIGVVAKSFGVSENTIRRMETAGLLTPALIKESGYRYYDYSNISRIKMILSLRSLGFVYEDMREYFKNPGDFSIIQQKLLDKKLVLDALIEHTNQYIKPKTPGEISILHHGRICLFSKSYYTDEPLNVRMMERYSSDALTEAIKAKYPVDQMRPVSILTDYSDYRDFDYTIPLHLTFCIPLRKEISAPDTITIPPRTILQLAWYKGVEIRSALDNFGKCMAANNLKQCDTLAATFEVGRHLDENIEDNGYLFHILVPCEKA